MPHSFLSLLQNISFLLAAALLFDIFAQRWRFHKTPFSEISVGFMLGCIGIAVMLTPWSLGEGLIFDTRSVLLGLSGLFFGTLPTLVTITMTAALRLHQGGQGMWTGAAVIIASGTIGIAWRASRQSAMGRMTFAELFLCGLTIHVVMLMLMLTLPWETALRVLSVIALPVLAIHPLGMALMGSLLVNRVRRESAIEDLRASEEKYQTLFSTVLDPILVVDRPSGRIVDCNTSAETYFGRPREQLLGLRQNALRPPVDGAEAPPLLHKPGLTENQPCLCADGAIRLAQVQASRFSVRDTDLLVGVFRDTTDRIQAETALRRSEERHRAYVDNAPCGIFIATFEGRFVDVNPEACAMSGYTRDELLTMAIPDLLPPGNKASSAFHVNRLLIAGRVEGEVRGLRKDGSRRWWSVSATRMPPDLLLGFVTDSTERRERDEARHIFLELLENAEDIVVFKDPDLRYVMVNRAYTTLTGHAPRDVIGRTDREVFAGLSSPAQIGAYIGNDRAALALPRGQSLTVEEGTLGPDGAVRTFLTRKFPIYAADGRLLGTGTMTSEITIRKRMEEALRQSEERFALVLEATNDGLWDWNLATGEVYFSPHYYTMLGYEPDEFAPGYATWRDMLHPEDRDDVERRITEHIEKASPFEIEFRMRTKRGRWMWIMGRGRVVDFDAAGRATRMVGTHVDQTERRRDKEQILRAKEEAEIANKAKSEFLANMSHEIRTPLNGIMGMLQLLQLTELSEEQTEYSDLAIQSTMRLNRLLSDILDISRIEAGKMKILAEPFVLRESIQQAVELLRPVALQSGVELRWHIDPVVPPEVRGDATRVQQVLINLIGNALKFTTSGNVNVEAYPLRPRQADQIRVFFSVTDTGCGISEEALGRLFQPFTQVDQGYTKSYQGAGLGLSICKRLIDLMGGNIVVESELGVGTTFSFCITFGLVAGIVPDHPAPAGPTTPRPSLRLLLAEDDEMSLMIGKQLLEKTGYIVDTARDGQEVLECLAARRIDLVLMDIQMPVMDGVEATARIRQGEAGAENATIPIIALTAYAMAGDREKLLASGMDGYVAKPVNVRDLHSVIDAALAK
jgi:PAS domain S-box-containing protein